MVFSSVASANAAMMAMMAAMMMMMYFKPTMFSSSCDSANFPESSESSTSSHSVNPFAAFHLSWEMSASSTS